MQARSKYINPLWERLMNASQRTYEADEVDGGVGVSELQHPIGFTLRSWCRPWWNQIVKDERYRGQRSIKHESNLLTRSKSAMQFNSRRPDRFPMCAKRTAAAHSLGPAIRAAIKSTADARNRVENWSKYHTVSDLWQSLSRTLKHTEPRW